MKLTNLLLSFFLPTPPPHVKKGGMKENSNLERALVILAATGEITNRDLAKFSNHPTKEISRLRRGGYVYPLGHPSGESWEYNFRTGKRYKRYVWTGKVPSNWVKTVKYIGRDRRKVKRGAA